MDSQQRKVGENEALYRAVNERVEALSTAFGTITDTVTVICECGDLSCSEQIVLPVTDYERIRADPTLFILLPGHLNADVEAVVEQHDGFEVVRKRPGEPAELARARDPRA